MSNLNILSTEQIEQKKYLDFLGSKDFPANIAIYNLPFDVYNKLFATHILVIGLQSTGINGGYVNLSYPQNIMSGGLSNHYPSIEFSFITTKNSLIENRKHTGSSLSIYNTQKDTNFAYSRAHSFRFFLLDYIKNLPMLNDSDNEFLSKSLKVSSKEIENFNFTNRFSKLPSKNKIKKLEEAYIQIVKNQPIIENFLNFHFLNQNLIENLNQVHTKRNKI